MSITLPIKNTFPISFPFIISQTLSLVRYTKRANRNKNEKDKKNIFSIHNFIVETPHSEQSYEIGAFLVSSPNPPPSPSRPFREPIEA